MKAEFIVPDRSRKQRRAAEAFERELEKLTGGYSVYAGHGVWRNPLGVLMRESHRRIECVHKEEVDLLTAFRRYGRAAGEHTLLYYIDGKAFATAP